MNWRSFAEDGYDLGVAADWPLDEAIEGPAGCRELRVFRPISRPKRAFSHSMTASEPLSGRAMAAVTPQSVLAEQHRKMAEPGSARGG